MGLVKGAAALQLNLLIPDVSNVVRVRLAIFVNDLAVSAIMSGAIDDHVIGYNVAVSAVV